MKNIVIIGLKLTIICAVAALCLGFVNVITLGKINQNKEAALKEALMVVNKAGTPQKEIAVSDKKQVTSYYPVKADSGAISSYILTLIGDGYGGDLKILANFEKSGKLIACVLMDNQETPGLGKEAERIEYMNKYIGTGGDKPIPVKKNQLSAKDADAIGGATITFTGIAKALEAGSEFVKTIGD